MSKRTGRGYVNKEAVLAKLSAGRSGAIQVQTQAKINSPEYEAADKVTKAIDELAKALTGDAELFWVKPHG